MTTLVEKTPAETFVPLKHVDFLILLVLMEHEMHGYGIVKEIGKRTGGQIQLEPGNLYRYVRRLLAEELLEEAEAPGDEDSGDERRRYYAATELGREVLNLEVGRLRALIEDFDSTGLVPRGGDQG